MARGPVHVMRTEVVADGNAFRAPCSPLVYVVLVMHGGEGEAALSRDFCNQFSAMMNHADSLIEKRLQYSALKGKG